MKNHSSRVPASRAKASSRKRAALQETIACVERHGWQCLAITPDGREGQPIFTYSIGFAKINDHPEIMIFDMPAAVAHGFLTHCYESIRVGNFFRPDVRYSNIAADGYDVVFKRVGSEHMPKYFGTAMRFYGDTPFYGLIMFWPDEHNRFPWESNSVAGQEDALGLIEEVN